MQKRQDAMPHNGLPYEPDQYIDEAFARFPEISAANAAARSLICVFEGAGLHKFGRIYFERMGDLSRAFGAAAPSADGVVGASTLILTVTPETCPPFIPDGDFVLQRINPFGDDTGEFAMRYINEELRRGDPDAAQIRIEYAEGHRNMMNYLCPSLAVLQRFCQLTSCGTRLMAQEMRGFSPPGC